MRFHRVGLPIVSWVTLALVLWAGTCQGKHNHWRSPFSHRNHHARASSYGNKYDNANAVSSEHRNSSAETSNLQARANNGRFTFYETGLGACGKYNNPGDFIVALNIEQWEDGKHCFETITIEHNGKKTEAQIVDLCPSCPWGALDFSQGLFGFFASEAIGVIHGHWYFGGAKKLYKTDKHKPTPKKGKGAPKLKTKPKPKPKSKPKPKANPSSTPEILGNLAAQAQDEVMGSANLADATAIIVSTTKEPLQLAFPTSLPSGIASPLVLPQPPPYADPPNTSVQPQATAALNEANLAIINLGEMLKKIPKQEP